MKLPELCSCERNILSKQMGKGINTGHNQEPADGRLEIITAQEKKIYAVFSLHCTDKKRVRKELPKLCPRAT